MANLIEELKRRNVIRVGLAYAVLSWILLQVGDVLFEALRLDGTAMTVLLAVILLGFVPVVVFSWVYELTPEGVKRESEIDRTQSITPQTGDRLNTTIIILLVAAIGMFAWERFAPREPAGPVVASGADDSAIVAADNNPIADQPSIAVLPFADMSAAGDQAYFGDGIAEELLNVLASIDGLKVAARTSSFKFRGAQHDIAEIGKSLKVKTVLEGSVRKAGDQIRVTAQLIKVDDGYHLWSQSFDRELDNIFAIQDEIAAAIVAALRLQLNLDASHASVVRPESGQAYNFYLQGRQLAREPSKEGFARALRYYEQALALDPDLHRVHGAIASAWVWLEDYGGVPAAEAFQAAEAAANRALALEPNQADALTAMGMLQDRKYGNHIVAREYFERALAANPSFVEAYSNYSDSMQDLGHVDEALALRKKVIELDPLSGFQKARLAGLLSAMGRYDEAASITNSLLEESPGDTYGFEAQANRYVRLGHLAEAVPSFRFVHENRPGDPYSAANIAEVYLVMGNLDAAREWIDAAAARGTGNRWELGARRTLAISEGNWQDLSRLGQLYLAVHGLVWQGESSLGQGDWATARAIFQNALERYNYVAGDPVSVNIANALAGLAMAEHRLGLPTWTQHADAARLFTQSMLAASIQNTNFHVDLARLSAIDRDIESTVRHIEDAFAQFYLDHWFLSRDPFFAAVRDEPRLVEIVRRMREHAQAERTKLESAIGG